MSRPGEPWGGPTSSPPDLEVDGGDADLAAAVARRPGLLVRFRPDASSDLARAIGLATDPGVAAGVALPRHLLPGDRGPVAGNKTPSRTPPPAPRPCSR